ncbi:MAG: hypothetical protein ACYDH4_01960 [Candidatus Cryosericum sp.]
MNKRMLWSRILCVTGLALIAMGAVVLVVPRLWAWWLVPVALYLPGSVSGFVALGALLGRSRYRGFVYCALVLTLCGSIAVYLLLGNFEASAVPWWEFVTVAYPVGVIMSLVGAVLVTVESFG